MFKPYFSEWLVRQYFSGWWVLGLAALLLAGCGPESKEEQGARIKSSLPSGCEIKSLGRYGGIDDLIVVFCDGQRTTSVNYTESHYAGKTRRTEQMVILQLGQPKSGVQ